jgi:hypothetical protein
MLLVVLVVLVVVVLPACGGDRVGVLCMHAIWLCTACGVLVGDSVPPEAAAAVGVLHCAWVCTAH